MKFKCGLTNEEKEAKHEAALAWAKDVIANGEVVFALWPKRIKPGDCRLLEKVRRFPAYVRKHYMECSYWSKEDIADPHRIAYATIKWRYEAIDK